ncbi:hypothetical protein [Aulosira sp. FACHB-615]|uniref:hypothetical protein n=1 Tax=Aulosira sp. FACHB-615 TaxID=2692777 RepID=UPI001684C291|nr:hypothetical protein [Aulosira sp. FACHB-615]MBD2488986.1 hypothetical protein [Aulosira sp. FACHB-615]
MSYWREQASEAIAKVLADAIASGMNLENLSETDKRELKGRIDASYPFGLRKNHPYKIWLDERRKVFYRYGLAQMPAPNRKPAIGCDSTVPGQLQLFDL